MQAVDEDSDFTCDEKQFCGSSSLRSSPGLQSQTFPLISLLSQEVSIRSMSCGSSFEYPLTSSNLHASWAWEGRPAQSIMEEPSRRRCGPANQALTSSGGSQFGRYGILAHFSSGASLPWNTSNAQVSIKIHTVRLFVRGFETPRNFSCFCRLPFEAFQTILSPDRER